MRNLGVSEGQIRDRLGAKGRQVRAEILLTSHAFDEMAADASLVDEEPLAGLDLR